MEAAWIVKTFFNFTVNIIHKIQIRLEKVDRHILNSLITLCDECYKTLLLLFNRI